jgi:serine/threonine protein kinase
MKLLQHIDGIPKVYNFCKYHRFNFIELQRLDRDLEHLLLDNKNLTPEEICDIGCQIIEVMKGVHGSHVIHRDIKPQNIMFDSNMKAYLIDFGISTLLNSKALKTKKIYKKIGFFIGTPRYASLSAHLG